MLPFAGELIATVGGVLSGIMSGVIVTVVLPESVRPPESATDAVIMCVPTDKLEEENVPPEPIGPSMLEIQTRLPLRLPSSVSLAVPVKITELPDKYELPGAGEVIAIVGEVLGVVIMTLMLFEPVKPPESVTEAVIVCVPTDKLDVENVPPEPIEPSMLEVQVRLSLRPPSSISKAQP